jgi:hypothetical protein
VELQFSIRPGVSPLDRGALEDQVVEALGEDADCVGGGGMLDGSESDFTIEIDGLDADEIVRRCRDVFALIAFSLPTVVELQIEGRTVHLPTAVQE